MGHFPSRGAYVWYQICTFDLKWVIKELLFPAASYWTEMRTLFVITIAVPQFGTLLLMSKLLDDRGAVNILLGYLGMGKIKGMKQHIKTR